MWSTTERVRFFSLARGPGAWLARVWEQEEQLVGLELLEQQPECPLQGVRRVLHEAAPRSSLRDSLREASEVGPPRVPAAAQALRSQKRS